MAPDDGADPQFVAYRLAQLEKQLASLQAHVDGRLDAIQGSIGTLRFVDKEVYAVQHRALEEKVDSARALAMWALGTTLTVVALVGTLIGILKLVSG